jgi:hypothetical protein
LRAVVVIVMSGMVMVVLAMMFVMMLMFVMLVFVMMVHGVILPAFLMMGSGVAAVAVDASAVRGIIVEILRKCAGGKRQARYKHCGSDHSVKTMFHV